jgi:hypothetical protein
MLFVFVFVERRALIIRSVYKKTQGPSGIDYRFVRKDNMHLIDVYMSMDKEIASPCCISKSWDSRDIGLERPPKTTIDTHKKKTTYQKHLLDPMYKPPQHQN